MGAYEGCIDSPPPILYWGDDPAFIGYPVSAAGDSPYEHWDLLSPYPCVSLDPPRLIYYELRDASDSSVPILLVRGHVVPGLRDSCLPITQIYVQY